MARLYPWLAAVLAIALMVVGYSYLKLQADMGLIRAELTEKSFHAEQDHRQIADYQKKLTAANEAAKKAEEELVAQDHAAAAQPTVGANRPRVISMDDISRDHPEYRELQRKQLRRSLLRQYGEGLAALNLAPDQLSQLKDLLVSRVFVSGDPRLAGLAPGTPAYNQAARAAAQAINEQITNLIGSDGQAKLRDAQNLTMAQNQVENTYAPDLEEGGVPLTSEQSRSLAQIMAPSSLPGQPPGSMQADPTTGLSPRDDAMLEQASQILSPAQVAILKSDRSDQNRMNAISQAYFSANRAAGSPPTIITTGGTTIISGR